MTAEELAKKECELVRDMLIEMLVNDVITYDLVNDCATLLATCAWRLADG